MLNRPNQTKIDKNQPTFTHEYRGWFEHLIKPIMVSSVTILSKKKKTTPTDNHLDYMYKNVLFR